MVEETDLCYLLVDIHASPSSKSALTVELYRAKTELSGT